MITSSIRITPPYFSSFFAFFSLSLFSGIDSIQMEDFNAILTYERDLGYASKSPSHEPSHPRPSHRWPPASKLGDKTQVLEILGPIKQRYPRVPHFFSSTASTVTPVFFRRIQSKKVKSNCSSLCNLCKISAIKHSTILSHF